MSKSKTKNGGELIKITPSARKSIHSHDYCLFAHQETMGGYGIPDKVPRTSYGQGSTEGGYDEVDNVMSKHQRTKSSSPVNHNIINRKFSLPNDDYSREYDSEGKLAKSLPTNLQLVTYYSNEDNLWDSTLKNNLESFNTSQESQYRTPESHRPHSTRNNREEEAPEKQNKATEKSGFSTILAVIIILVAGFTAYYFSEKLQLPKKSQYDNLRFTEELDALAEKHNLNSNAMLQISEGLYSIHQKDIAGSFIFLYNSSREEFDGKHFNNVVDSIASVSARFLRNESESVRHLSIEGGSLDMKEHGEVICAYRKKVSEVGVMLVRDVDAVPAALAMAFHYYCDEYDPLIKRSAVFFTLDLDNCSAYAEGDPSHHTLLERCLAGKWRGLRQDNVGPLLTRVVSIVIDMWSSS